MKVFIIIFSLSLILSIGVAESHISSSSMVINRGVYDIYFELSPPYYIPNTESILSYSILKGGNDIRNIIVSFKIERDGDILYSFEDIRFESSDFSIKYTFPDYGTYIATLTAYIEKDEELLDATIEINLDDQRSNNAYSRGLFFNNPIVLTGIILGIISGSTFMILKMRSR